MKLATNESANLKSLTPLVLALQYFVHCGLDHITSGTHGNISLKITPTSAINVNIVQEAKFLCGGLLVNFNESLFVSQSRQLFCERFHFAHVRQYIHIESMCITT